MTDRSLPLWPGAHLPPTSHPGLSLPSAGPGFYLNPPPHGPRSIQPPCLGPSVTAAGPDIYLTLPSPVYGSFNPATLSPPVPSPPPPRSMVHPRTWHLPHIHFCPGHASPPSSPGPRFPQPGQTFTSPSPRGFITLTTQQAP